MDMPVSSLFTVVSRNIIIVVVILITACKNSDTSEQSRFLALLDSTLQANNRLNAGWSSESLRILEDKTADPATSEKARYFLPKAQLVEQHARAIKNQIASLIPKDGNKVKLLRTQYEKIEQKYLKFKSDVTAIDNSILTNYKDDFNSDDPFYIEPWKLNSKTQYTFLQLLQSRISQYENRVIDFLNNNIGSTGGPIYDYFSAIITSNTTVVKPGETLEIIAGIGAFSKASNPAVVINGRTMPINDSGYARVVITAPRNAGKYKLPVEISYVDFEGKTMSIKQQVRYSVFDCNN